MQAQSQKQLQLLLAIWFGFFGAFLIGASWKFLSGGTTYRLIALGMALYGLLFFAYYPIVSRRSLLKIYFLLMTLGATTLSARLAFVAVKRPSAYAHWDDWLLLAFLLAGAWSILPVLWGKAGGKLVK